MHGLDPLHAWDDGCRAEVRLRSEADVSVMPCVFPLHCRHAFTAVVAIGNEARVPYQRTFKLTETACGDDATRCKCAVTQSRQSGAQKCNGCIRPRDEFVVALIAPEAPRI